MAIRGKHLTPRASGLYNPRWIEIQSQCTILPDSTTYGGPPTMGVPGPLSAARTGVSLMRRATILAWVALLGSTTLQAAEVTGRVTMPEACSPAVSPAVVVLESRGGSQPTAGASPTRVALVHQRGLQ